MSKRYLGLIILTSAFLGCQHNVNTGDWSQDKKFATLLHNQESDNNGIEVGEPEIYDDASLRLMLEAAEQRLKTINAITEAPLLTHLGATTGQTFDQTQVGLQVTGPSLAGTETTAKGGTTNIKTSPTGEATTETNAPSTDVKTTKAAQAPPSPPTITGGSSFTPGQVSGSTSDFLNEQMQLTYEIAGLRLMLEGSVSARFVKNQRIIKPRATIGFPISVSPRPRYRNAVAVVEIEVANPAENLAPNDPPIVTAILPQEKTYNVAALTDQTTSIGAGAIIGTVGIAGNFLRAHRTLYLVQDQDTVAIQRPRNPDSKNMESTTSFAWEFRPVLGRDFVRGGQRRTFVQLAFPVLNGKDCLGTVHLRTYWRYFDKKAGISEEVIAGSVLSRTLFPIPHYDLSPSVGEIRFQDLGDGTISVSCSGRFMTGTYVQVGPTRFDTSSGLKIDESGLNFIAPIAAFARWTGRVVARDGEASDLLNTSVQKKLLPLNQLSCIGVNPVDLGSTDQKPCDSGSISLLDPSLRTLNDNETEVTVRFNSTKIDQADSMEILLDIGHKIFGLSDTNVKRTFATYDEVNGAGEIKAVVPTSLLASSRRVRAFRPFWAAPDGEQARDERSACFDETKYLSDFSLESSTQSLTLVSVDSKGTASYILYGNGLSGASVVAPGIKAKLESIGGLPKDHALLVRVKKADLRKNTKLIIRRYSPYGLLVLDLPQPEATPPKDPKPQTPPKITLDSPVVQNTDELDVSVEKSADLSSVKMNETVLQFTPGKNSIRLKNLKASNVTSEQLTRELTFEYKDKTIVKVKLDVVAARVGVK